MLQTQCAAACILLSLLSLVPLLVPWQPLDVVLHETLSGGGDERTGDVGVLFHVLTTQEGLARYLHGHSREWLDEVRSVGALAFSVGRRAGDAQRDWTATLSSLRTRLPDVSVRELDVDDLEYPPISKTMAAFEILSAEEGRHAFVFNTDDDTHFHPLRMAALVALRNASEPLYMGRPLANCKCVPGQPTGVNCSAAVATSYCSGAGYGFSRATLLTMRGRWRQCWTERREDCFDRVRSSDVFVGVCLNAHAGVGCSPAASTLASSSGGVLASSHPAFFSAYLEEGAAAAARADAAHYPMHGTAWGAFLPQGHQRLQHTLFCQDSTHNGGIAQRKHIASPHLLNGDDIRLCAYFHPLKIDGVLSGPHLRFTRLMMNRMVEDALLSWSAEALSLTVGSDALVRAVKAAGHCRLAISVQSRPSDVARRNIIRSTWKRVADAIALDEVLIVFTLGLPVDPLPPHEQAALDAEASAEVDILRLNVTECSSCTYSTYLAWLDWALANTECDFIMKVDDSVYLRIAPLLSFLARFGPGSVDNLYFGMSMPSDSKADKDPASLGYAGSAYSHEFLPPFIHGHAVGLSRNLARAIGEMAAASPDEWRVEEAALGIFIDTLVANKSTGEPIIFGDDRGVWRVQHACTLDTVWDDPSLTYIFDAEQRMEEDLSGQFCAHFEANKRSAAPQGARMAMARSASS